MQGQSLRYLPRILKFFYYSSIVSAFCANILVVGQTSFLSVLGASLALRGPDGSMMTATNGLYEERKFVFQAFAYGLIATVASVVLCVWLMLPPEAALVCMIITMYTVKVLVGHYERVKRKFAFDEDETVDFTDLFDGPGAIRIRNATKGKRGSKVRNDSSYDSDEDLEMTNYDDEDLEEQKNLTRRRNLKKRGGGVRFGKSKRRDTQDGEHDYEDVPSTDLSEEDPQSRRRVRQQNPYSLATV